MYCGQVRMAGGTSGILLRPHLHFGGTSGILLQPHLHLGGPQGFHTPCQVPLQRCGPMASGWCITFGSPSRSFVLWAAVVSSSLSRDRDRDGSRDRDRQRQKQRQRQRQRQRRRQRQRQRQGQRKRQRQRCKNCGSPNSVGNRFLEASLCVHCFPACLGTSAHTCTPTPDPHQHTHMEFPAAC